MQSQNNPCVKIFVFLKCGNLEMARVFLTALAAHPRSHETGQQRRAQPTPPACGRRGRGIFTPDRAAPAPKKKATATVTALRTSPRHCCVGSVEVPWPRLASSCAATSAAAWCCARRFKVYGARNAILCATAAGPVKRRRGKRATNASVARRRRPGGCKESSRIAREN